MNYEELTNQTKALEKERERLYSQYGKKIYNLKMAYIKEHRPLDVKRFQRIEVTLCITEEFHKTLSASRQKMRKYQVGQTYSVSGIFNGWNIGDDGQVKPCFYGGEVNYSWLNKVVKVELTPEQPCGDCVKCHKYRDGLCFLMGGRDKRCAVWRITDDMVVCPNYEEVVPDGLYTKPNIFPQGHYRNVTYIPSKKIYRLYSEGWGTYTIESEAEVEAYYSFEPIEGMEKIIDR